MAAAAAAAAPAAEPVPVPVDKFELPLDAIQLDATPSGPAIMGSGAEGTVYAGMLYGTYPVAVKQVTTAELGAVGAAAADGGKAQLQLHRLASKSDHVVTLYGVATLPDGRFEVMERMAGSAHEFLLRRTAAAASPLAAATLATRLTWVVQLADGLAFVHSIRIVHADVKPNNVLLTTEEEATATAKLGDFGSCVPADPPQDGVRGSYPFMAPELLSGTAPATAASDVYSFGITAWCLLTGLDYYGDMVMDAARTEMADTIWQRRTCEEGYRPAVAALAACGVPLEVEAVLVRCWAAVASARPTMREVESALRAVRVASGTGGSAVAGAASGAPAAHGGAGGGSDDGGSRAGAAMAGAAAPCSESCSGDGVSAGVAAAPCAAARGGGGSGSGSTSPAAAGHLVPSWGAAEQAFALRHSGHSLRTLPDGTLVGGAIDGGVRRWDVTPGSRRIVASYDCLARVASLEVLAGPRLACGCFDGMLRIWDLSRVPAVREEYEISTDRHSSSLRVMLLLPQPPNRYLVIGRYDGPLVLFDVQAGCVLHTIKPYAAHTRVACLASLSATIFVSVNTLAEIRLWGVSAAPDPQLVHLATLQSGSCYSRALAVLPGGRLAVGAGSTLQLWHVRRRQCTPVASSGAGNLRAMVVVAEKYLACAWLDKVQVLDVDDCAWVSEVVLYGKLDALAVLPRGDLVTSNRGGGLTLYTRSDVAHGAAPGLGENLDGIGKHARQITTIVRLTSSVVLTGGDDGDAILWDIPQGAPATKLQQVRVGSTASQVGAACQWTHSRVVVGCYSGDLDVLRLDGAALVLVARVSCGDTVRAVTSVDDTTLAVGTFSGAVRLVHIDGGRASLGARLEGHEDAVRALLPLPGNRLASGSLDETVRLWHTPDSAALGVLRGHTGGVTALAQVSDTQLAVAAWGGDVRVWDLTAPLPLHPRHVVVWWGRPCDGVCMLSQSPAGWLVSSGGIVRLWNGGSHTEHVCKLAGRAHAMQYLDGGRLAFAYWDKDNGSLFIASAPELGARPPPAPPAPPPVQRASLHVAAVPHTPTRKRPAPTNKGQDLPVVPPHVMTLKNLPAGSETLDALRPLWPAAERILLLYNQASGSWVAYVAFGSAAAVDAAVAACGELLPGCVASHNTQRWLSFHEST